MNQPGGQKVPAKLANQRHKYSIFRRQLTLQAACEGDKLRPWQKALAVWYADQVKTPTAKQVQDQALSFTSGQPIGMPSIRKLLNNPTWLAFVTQCEEELVTKARTTFEARLPRLAELHCDAAEKLFETGKYEHIAKFTNPAIDRIWPLSQGPTLPAQIIQIHLGAPGSFSAINAKRSDAIEIASVAEVVESA